MEERRDSGGSKEFSEGTTRPRGNGANPIPPPGPIVVSPIEGSFRSLSSRRSAPSGSVPGTLSIPADAQPIEIRAIEYCADSIREFSLPDASGVSGHLDPQHVCWFDVVGFGDGVALTTLGEQLGIHPLAIADIVHTPQRAKFETYGDRYVIVLHMGQLDQDRHVDFEQVTLVLGPTWVVTFQERPGDVFEPVRVRLRENLGALREAGPGRLAYALVDAIVDGYFPILEAVGEDLGDLEDIALEATGSSQIQDIHRMRRRLIQLHRILWGHRQTASSMLRDESGAFDATVRLYLRDIHDHAIHQLDLVETLRELAAAIIEIHLSSISNRMNEVMKTLTVIASLFIPLTFLTGVYGMNFQYMPELAQRWAYPVFWAVIVVIALVLLLWFRSRGWLRGSS